jgi:hypothetical protein
MADFKVEGLDLAQAELDKLAHLPAEGKKEILTAMASVAMEAQRREGLSMGVYDRENNGKHAIDSIGLTKPKITEDGGKISVTFKGSRTDKKHKKKVRHAEIMFVNEYGKRGQQPRPAIRTANAKAEERIQQAGQAAFDRLQKQNN